MRTKPRRSGCLWLCLTLIIIGSCAWLFRDKVRTFAAQALTEDDGAIKADAIVVLGGDGFGTRIIRGAELAKSGYSARLLISSPQSVLGNESDMTIAFAVKKGYPASMFEPVILPPEDDSTKTEARYIGAKLKAAGVSSIDLVTSNFHTRRAAWLWRKENPWLNVHVVPAPDPYFTPESWFKTRAGQKTFLLEWTKTVSAHLGN